jgi:hypothetical protein
LPWLGLVFIKALPAEVALLLQGYTFSERIAITACVARPVGWVACD